MGAYRGNLNVGDMADGVEASMASARALIVEALRLLDSLPSFSAQIAGAHLAHALELIDQPAADPAIS